MNKELKSVEREIAERWELPARLLDKPLEYIKYVDHEKNPLDDVERKMLHAALYDKQQFLE